MKIINHLLVFGISTFIAICAMIISTLALNEQGIDDGHIVNIAGRERMLSQLSTKETFYRSSHNSNDFSALLAAVEEFGVNLAELKERESSRFFLNNDSLVILRQIDKINSEWESFLRLLSSFIDHSERVFLAREKWGENVKKISQALKESSQNKAQIQLTKAQNAEILALLTQAQSALYRLTVRWEAAEGAEFVRLCLEIENKIKSTRAEILPLWAELDLVRISESGVILAEVLNEISQKNIALLEQIDWMVGLFAAVADKRRAHIILVQYICAAFLALIFAYGAWLICSVNKQLKSLLQKTNKLAYDGVFPRSNEFGGNEISIVSRNISHFLEKLNLTKETSQKARELSLAISDEIANVIEEIRTRLKDSKLDESKRENILRAIDLGEDIAIHSSEHLLAAARSLEKLQKILNEL